MSNTNSRKYYQYYSLEELSLMKNPYRFRVKLLKSNHPMEETLKQKDDELKTNTWTELYKTAAYYYDNPNLVEKIEYLIILDLIFQEFFQKLIIQMIYLQQKVEMN